jgi:hypothetical protein
VYEGPDTASHVITTLRANERIRLGGLLTDQDGQPWIEARTPDGRAGFVTKASPLSTASFTAVFAVLAIGALVLGGVMYGIVESGVSIGKLAMLALGTYGGLVGMSKRK